LLHSASVGELVGVPVLVVVVAVGLTVVGVADVADALVEDGSGLAELAESEDEHPASTSARPAGAAAAINNLFMSPPQVVGKVDHAAAAPSRRTFVVGHVVT